MDEYDVKLAQPTKFGLKANAVANSREVIVGIGCVTTFPRP